MAAYSGRGLHGHIVETIGGRILDGTYSPGQTVYPEELERELEVSKTVVREALRVLASKGLVDSRPKRGTFVRPRSEWSLLDASLLRWQRRGAPDRRFLADLAEVRAIIEPAGARLAAVRRTEADLAAMREALAGLADPDADAAAVIEADLRFHRALLAAAHNELMGRLEVVVEAGLRERDRIVHAGERWPDAVPAHRAVLDGVAAGDPAAAAAAVESLLEQASSDLAHAAGSDAAAAATPPSPRDPVAG
jgi:DNA-binding FadR family transcriptional regulator